MAQLWGGRFTKETDKLVYAFNASISFDKRFYRQDIAGSIAHVTMLEKQGILTGEEKQAIIGGLEGILRDVEEGTLAITEEYEDIHSFVEAVLIERIGEPGKKLHTGRSRNDQVALDMKLYTREEVKETDALVGELLEAILKIMDENLDTYMPGFTHLQKAQPVTLAHHMGAYFEMFWRDHIRLLGLYDRMNTCPLGSGALAGTTYPLDREYTARLLGFGNIMLLLTGDVFALLFYAACVYMAVKLIPFGKAMMAAISLLPMALETAGSFSYDVLVNGLSFLFIGYVFYLAYEREGARLKDWILMAVIIFFLAPVKVVYVLLAFLCLLIPMKSRKKFWLGTAGVVAAGGISCLILRLTAIMNLAVQSGAGSAGTAEQTYSISYILSDIPRVIGVLYNTLCRQTDAIFAPLYGQKLGYWDVSVPYYISFGLVLVLAVSLLAKDKERIYIKSWHKILMLVLIIGMTGGITLSMMLDFTDVTDTVVRGIQGRYFIPFLPLAGFLFRGDRIVVKKNLDSDILMFMYLLNYFSLWRIFEEIIAR